MQEEQEARAKKSEVEEDVEKKNQMVEKEVKTMNQEVEDQVTEAKRELEEEQVMRSGVFPPTHGLVLFHLPPLLGEAGLVQMFQQFGTLVGVRVLQGSSGSPYAFVFFSTADEAEVARGEMAPWAPFTFARPNKPYTPLGQWAIRWHRHICWCEQQKLQNQPLNPRQPQNQPQLEDKLQPENQHQSENQQTPGNQQLPVNHKGPEKPSLKPENPQSTPTTSTKEPENQHKLKISVSDYQKRLESKKRGRSSESEGKGKNSEGSENMSKKVKLETSEDEVTESLNGTMNTENNVSRTEVSGVKVKEEKGETERSEESVGGEDREGSESKGGVEDTAKGEDKEASDGIVGGEDNVGEEGNAGGDDMEGGEDRARGEGRGGVVVRLGHLPAAATRDNLTSLCREMGEVVALQVGLTFIKLLGLSMTISVWSHHPIPSPSPDGAEEEEAALQALPRPGHLRLPPGGDEGKGGVGGAGAGGRQDHRRAPARVARAPGDG